MWSNQFLKIPFRSRGRDITGADCWGLVRIIYREKLGIELPLLAEYENVEDKVVIKKIITETSSRWSPIPLGQEKPYDVCVFNIMGQVWHIGLVVKPSWMIHCQKVSNTVHSNYVNENEWKKRLEGFYRYAEHPDIDTSV